jgi:hypothetical protein
VKKEEEIGVEKSTQSRARSNGVPYMSIKGKAIVAWKK